MAPKPAPVSDKEQKKDRNARQRELSPPRSVLRSVRQTRPGAEAGGRSPGPRLLFCI